TKKRDGVSRSRLKQAAATGSLPQHALIRPDDGFADWQLVSTVKWLSEEASIPEARYCLECDSRVIAEQGAFGQIKRCPECGSLAEFVDFLNEEEPIQDVPIEPWGKYDRIAVTFTYLIGLVGVCAAISLFFSPFLAVLLSFIFVASGAYLIVVTYQHRSETAKYREHLSHVENALAERTELLSRQTQELRSLRRSLEKVRDDLIVETEEVCREQQAKAEAHLQRARDSSGAVDRIAERYLEEQRKWWTQKLRGDNFPLQKGRIQKAIEFARKQGYDVPKPMEQAVMAKLKEDYAMVLRKEKEQERQRQLREQIREEQRAEKARREAEERAEAERRQYEAEQEAIRAALQVALSRAGAEHSAEVDAIRKQLEEAEQRALEAEERNQRAISQAQLTKTGHVYVISNIGSFGQGVFKIGLTRRLEPLDRIRELGDASVPFPFDIHMMIFSEDAPTLEHTLHVALHKQRLNKVNLRKEFFRTDLEVIREVVETHHGVVEYAADAEALDYRQSLEISDEDYAFIEAAAESAGLDYESDEE
ncbi:MAG: GIY-YIG nuclease family protein, partial [Planctomycetaceae bacterium]|nr:GIY-YIG nuclease family protein [Planctomycetaceae bacterium]